MMKRVSLFFVLCTLCFCTCKAAPKLVYYGDTLDWNTDWKRTQCGTLDIKKNIVEVSGIACSRVTPGFIWMQSDEREDRIIATDEKGDELKEMVDTPTGVAEIKQITATVADYGTTRSELYREGDAINFRWSAGDKLGIFPDSGDQVSFAIDDSQAGSLTATFDGGGWALKPSHSYTVYFPYIRNIDLIKSAIPLDYTGQTQTFFAINHCFKM